MGIEIINTTNNTCVNAGQIWHWQPARRAWQTSLSTIDFETRQWSDHCVDVYVDHKINDSNNFLLSFAPLLCHEKMGAFEDGIGSELLYSSNCSMAVWAIVQLFNDNIFYSPNSNSHQQRKKNVFIGGQFGTRGDSLAWPRAKVSGGTVWPRPKCPNPDIQVRIFWVASTTPCWGRVAYARQQPPVEGASLTRVNNPLLRARYLRASTTPCWEHVAFARQQPPIAGASRQQNSNSYKVCYSE